MGGTGGGRVGKEAGRRIGRRGQSQREWQRHRAEYLAGANLWVLSVFELACMGPYFCQVCL